MFFDSIYKCAYREECISYDDIGNFSQILFVTTDNINVMFYLVHIT